MHPTNGVAGCTNSILFYQREMAECRFPTCWPEKDFTRNVPNSRLNTNCNQNVSGLSSLFTGKQFLARNSCFLIHNENKVNYNLELLRILPGTTVKCVNDEEMLERRIETNSDRRSCFDNDFNKIPLHCYLYMFHLELHQNIWVHVQNLEEYQYKPELRTKLVLPPEHRTLIDILTSHNDVLMDDIIEGKSGGTTILCMGAAGLGKTLTAEVYSEVVGKPLYRVHSGQLGTSAVSVEAALFRYFASCRPLGCHPASGRSRRLYPRRDNDLQHNAIVAEFLRTLEYFDGLLFMTTNRGR